MSLENESTNLRAEIAAEKARGAQLQENIRLRAEIAAERAKGTQIRAEKRKRELLASSPLGVAALKAAQVR